MTDFTPAVSPLRAWILAARPKTLAASATPVIVGSALAAAADRFQIVPAALCFLFAVFSQIGANLINDWADFRKGVDQDDRLGPDRMVAVGLISPRQMFTGALCVFAVACGFGLGLVFFGGLKLIAVGAVCALFAMAYSAGPLPLAYCGLGDVLVVVFFGLVPVFFTFFIQTETWTAEVLWTGWAVGLATDNILIANNYRDREQDRANRKFTLIALLGERFGRFFYLVNGLAAGAIFLITSVSASPTLAVWVMPILWFGRHIQTWRKLNAIRQGSELNVILEESAKNLLIFGLFYLLQTLLIIRTIP